MQKGTLHAIGGHFSYICVGLNLLVRAINCCVAEGSAPKIDGVLDA